MAKPDDVSFIERHVEKLVLLASLIFLALAAYHWLPASPTRLALFGPRGAKVTVGPGEADETLHKAAMAVRDRTGTYPLNVPPDPKWAGRTAELRRIEPARSDYVALALPQPGLWMPGARDEAGATVAELIGHLVAMPALNVSAAEVLPQRQPAGDVVAVAGEMVFPARQQLAVWDDQVLRRRLAARFIVQKVVVRAQQLLDDGQWSAPREVATVAVPASDAQGKPLVVPELPDYDGKNAEQVRKVREELDGQWQKRLLHPDYWPVLTPAGQWGVWTPPWPNAELGAGDVRIVFYDDATVKLGQTWRYSAQLVLVNPLLTQEDVVPKKSADDARVKHIRTKFTDWSAPVSVRRVVCFFLTGAGELPGPGGVMMPHVKATVFTRKWSQWVMKEFRIFPGEPIGGPETVAVWDPLTGARRNEAVDFRTGAVVLDFRADANLVLAGVPRRTFLLTCLSADGSVARRYLAMDQEAPEFRRLRAAAEQRPQAAASPRAKGT